MERKRFHRDFRGLGSGEDPTSMSDMIECVKRSGDLYLKVVACVQGQQTGNKQAAKITQHVMENLRKKNTPSHPP